MLFDSHAHYDDSRFDEDRFELIEAVHSDGVGYILNSASDVPSSRKAIYLAEKYPFIYASAGVHPHEAGKADNDAEKKIYELLKNKKVVAVGEIGLDYYYDHSPRDIQKKWFARQIGIAREAGLPLIIHNRDAHEDVMRIAEQENAKQVGGVFHCYSGSAEMAARVLKNNFYISVGGPVTFKNAGKTAEVVQTVPIDRLLVETDCPYLAPEPFRGKRNHSGYLPYIVEKISQLKGLSFEEVEKITADNAKRLFKIAG